MQRLGLFGGSFDPIHLGHLLMAQAAFEELQLTRLYFIPAARSPFKPDRQPAPDAQRTALIRLALAGEARCEVDEQELTRQGTSAPGHIHWSMKALMNDLGHIDTVLKRDVYR